MKSISEEAQKRQVSFVPAIENMPGCAETAEGILQECLQRLGARSASIFLTEDGNGRLSLLKAIGPRENRHLGKTIRLGEGISGYVAEKKKPLLVADFSKAGNVVSRKQRNPVDTFMSSPVLSGSSVLAVVNVAGRESGPAFAGSDLEKFQKILARYKDVLERIVDDRRSLYAREALVEGENGIQESLADIGKQLQELKSYNATILQCLSQYVLIFDHHLNISYCSKERDFVGLFGLRQDIEITKQSVLDLPFDVERNALKRRLDGLLLGGSPFSLNDIRLKDCPETRIVNMFFSPFSSSEGDLLGGLLLVDDNTKDHEMRQRLAEAEKLSLIGSLTSMITHEVNNPLDGVMRLINLSLAHIDDDQVKEYLTEAQKGLRRIASLVRSLLGFSRKGISLDAEFTPLNTLIDNSISITQNSNAGRDASFHLKLTPENPSVRTSDFYQIISNLLSNASDAVKDESGNVTVETRLEDGRLHLIVEDDGCGIPKKMQSHMFDTFWTTKEYGKGTGLGLAIVKKLVEKNGGSIEVESEKNAGTKMHLVFQADMLPPSDLNQA